MPGWLQTLDRHVPIRFLTLLVCAITLAVIGWRGVGGAYTGVAAAGAGLLMLGTHDLLQRRHAVLRNYPLIGHLRFLLEWIRPELRQYFIESDNEAAPFSRQQRSLVYQRAKGESDKRAFGSQRDVQATGHEWMSHSMAPTTLAGHDFRVRIGSAASCTQPYHASVFNISAMSFGALSANAILALNGGAKRGGFAHDTGEGSISTHHRVHGGDLIWEIGSGYFGCRDEQGGFDPIRFAEQATEPQVKMIEIKLSQGGLSPTAHSAFGTPVELMLFIERLRRLSGGKPVGIKLCVGHPWEWFALVKAMLHTHVAPDFIVVDGSEGGTGAAPLEFADHVGMPLQEGLRLVHDTLVGTGLRERIRIGCAGKVVSAFDIARAMALGADWCNSARGFMFALGCIQAQNCHTGACPTGVATQDKLRQRALVVPDKIERVERFHRYTLEALKELVQAAGLTHPREIGAAHIQRRVSSHEISSLADLLVDVVPGAVLAAERGEVAWPDAVFARDWPRARADSFSPALPPSRQPSLGAEHPVAGVAQARHDVAVLVELPVDGRGVDRHVGVVGVKVREALGR